MASSAAAAAAASSSTTTTTSCSSATATTSCSSSSTAAPFLLSQRPDLNAVRGLAALVDCHVSRFLADSKARRALQQQCSKVLAASNHKYFEFSEQSVLSNLYWGIENMEGAIESSCHDERAAKLGSAEKMLQVPALLEEEGSTAGIENVFLVCYAYFYLALVRRLRGDVWQMTAHLLQSLLVSTDCFKTQLAPELWESLFGSLPAKSGCRASEEADQVARQQVRRFKDCLMYYQVISYGCSDAEKHNMEEAEDYLQFGSTASCKRLNSIDKEGTWLNHPNANSAYLLQAQRSMNKETIESLMCKANEHAGLSEPKDRDSVYINLDGDLHAVIKEEFDMKCLQDMLQESQSNSPVSFYSQNGSPEESDSEAKRQCQRCAEDILSIDSGHLTSKIDQRNYLLQCSPPALKETASPECQEYLTQSECNTNKRYLLPTRSLSELDNLRFSMLGVKDADSHPFHDYHLTSETPRGGFRSQDLRCFSNFSSKLRKKYSFTELVTRGSFSRRRKNVTNSEKEWSEGSSNFGKDMEIELLKKFEKTVSSLCFSEYAENCEDADTEVTTIWELLKKKKEVKCSSAKREILDQLLDIIAASRMEKVIRASVSILLLLVSEDKTIIQDIKKKNLYLYDLAGALKRNVHEAAILIYLLNPSPSEIKSLELLPALVEVACCPHTKTKESILLPLTPTSASIAMIEVLVTAFDYVTNNMHLATISSPHVLSKLVSAMNNNLEEVVALTAILIRCMRLNGNCKKFLSQATPVDPFLHLLRSNEKCAKVAALEYFHEILRIPRSSAIQLLHQIRQHGSISIMYLLMACMKQTELQHRLLAANLLLQLDILETPGKSVFKEEAIEVLLESITTEENPSAQTLSLDILSNIGGTYSWAGEPYTAAWLLKKAGLTSTYHRNMVKNVDWLDSCLQDSEINSWSAKCARSLMRAGSSLFKALEKGINSQIRGVSHDSLVCIAWLGSEMAILGSNNLRYSACELLLNEIAHFLHPGSEFDERILSCLCVYNYTSGKGKQKLMNFSEGSRESLRRLSGVTWMAEELLKVTDYFLPTKPRVSCVHTQILDLENPGSAAVTALIFYKGQLCAGYADGFIKVWDIKGQKTKLVREVKEHKKAITCFALSEPRDSILSGSSDKTIRVWKMVEGKLECTEVIEIKESIQKLDTFGDKILVVTQGRGLKVWHASRNIQTFCKNKYVKSLAVSNDKIYLGCTDSSIQEVDILEDNKTEIRAPMRRWRMRHKSINAIKLYKGWVYSASAVVEGSSMKDWRKRRQPEVSIAMAKRTTVQAMEVVEDFIYLTCSSSNNTIQIWLRGQQQKVGRLSTGSKITKLLTANDIIICGTESGSIKGWIPL